MKRTVNVFEAFDGTVGTVVELPEDEDTPVVHEFKNGDKVSLSESGFKVNDQELGVDEEVGDTNDFEFDVDNLVLFMETGYRGDGCYWGMYYDEENKRWLGIDFVSDGVVYTLA